MEGQWVVVVAENVRLPEVAAVPDYPDLDMLAVCHPWAKAAPFDRHSATGDRLLQAVLYRDHNCDPLGRCSHSDKHHWAVRDPIRLVPYQPFLRLALEAMHAGYPACLGVVSQAHGCLRIVVSLRALQAAA